LGDEEGMFGGNDDDVAMLAGTEKGKDPYWDDDFALLDRKSDLEFTREEKAAF